MLPEAKADPACFGKPLVRVAVTAHVAFQLGAPPIGTGSRPRGMDRARVPIAAVDEYRDPPGRERDIGTPPHPVKRKLEINPVAEPAMVQLLPERDFGRGTGTLLADHACPCRRR